MDLQPALALSRRCFALLLALLFTAAPWAAAQDADAPDTPDAPARPVVHVYLLSGQSNMVGSGQVSELSEAWRQPIDGAMLYSGKGFEVLTASAGRFGPELGFAKVMRQARPDRRIFLIKFALSGQPLHAGFDGGNWQGATPGPNRKTFYPGIHAEDENIGLHYQALMRHAQAGYAALRDQGLEPQLQGVVWMQGEADAKNEVSATQYAQSLKLLKQRIEQDLNSEPVPFVFGQVLPHEPALDRFTHRSECRQSMANADMHSGHADAIPGCIMVPTENMPLNNDTVHYNTEGVLLLGQAFGKAMVDVQAKLTAE